MSPLRRASPVEINAALLRQWALPRLDAAGDKEARGRVLVVGGSQEMPGAVLLAAEAALRVGAGKLRIAVPASIAFWVGAAVPEARVFALPEGDGGAIAVEAAATLAERANEGQAVLIGPGMTDEAAVAQLVTAIIPQLHGPQVVLDAAALRAVEQDAATLAGLGGNAILTPHAGEMASCLGEDKETVTRDPAAVARHAAARFRAVVALKGADTVIANPEGECWINRAGNVGLATSGSGDTLAGLIAGLAARGAEPQQAAAWGVHLHALAGDRLAARLGGVGFLARELLPEIPRLLAELE